MLIKEYCIRGKCDICSRKFEIRSMISMEDAIEKSNYIGTVNCQMEEPRYWEVLPNGVATCTLCQWKSARYEEGIKKGWPKSRQNDIYPWREMCNDEIDRIKGEATCEGKDKMYIKSRCSGDVRYHQKVGVSDSYLCEKHFRHPPKCTQKYLNSPPAANYTRCPPFIGSQGR